MLHVGREGDELAVPWTIPELVLERHVLLARPYDAARARVFLDAPGERPNPRPGAGTLTGVRTVDNSRTPGTVSTSRDEVDRVTDQPRDRRRARGARHANLDAVGAARPCHDLSDLVAAPGHFLAVAQQEQLGVARHRRARDDRRVGIVGEHPAHVHAFERRLDMKIQDRGARQRVDRREDAPRPDGAKHRPGIHGRVTRERAAEHDMITERQKTRLVARNADHARQAAIGILGAAPDAAVRIRPAERHHRPRPRAPVPAVQRGGTVKQARHRRPRAQEVPDPGAGDARARLIPPFAVGVQPLDPVHGRPVVRPAQRGLWRIRVRREAEASDPGHVVDDGLGGATERIRRARHVDRDVVPLVGADLHAVEHEDAVQVRRRIRRTRAVPVVRENDEPQSCARGCRRDGVPIADPVRACGVDVVRPGDGARGEVRRERCRERLGPGRRDEEKQKDAGRDKRAQRQHCRSANWRVPIVDW